ncbi:hypothetical protein [Mesobacillus zeae]|uniref:hypothetical protein n=1 Tax=Mesobacillus zeae TaxID=1917180 RepID=UPI00115D470D|nr:hypothetical protein [Mesobacillus zeae]
MKLFLLSISHNDFLKGGEIRLNIGAIGLGIVAFILKEHKGFASDEHKIEKLERHGSSRGTTNVYSFINNDHKNHITIRGGL